MVLLAAFAFTGALTPSASANATATFWLAPSDTDVGANPDVELYSTFSYSDSNQAATDSHGDHGMNVCDRAYTSGGQCDGLGNLSVAFSPGFLINPLAAPETCTPAQFAATVSNTFNQNQSQQCPADTEIGYGSTNVYEYDHSSFGTTSVQNRLSARVFVMPGPAGALDGVGIVVYHYIYPVTSVTGVLTTDANGTETLTLGQFGNTDLHVPNTMFQITGLGLTFPGTTDDGTPVVTNATSCVDTTSTFSFATFEQPTEPSILSSFGMTACDPVPFSLTPSSTTYGDHPDLSASTAISYPDSSAAASDSNGNTGPTICMEQVMAGSGCVQLSSVKLDLAPGMTLNPQAAAATCSSSQLASNSCTAAAQVGTAPLSYYEYSVNGGDSATFDAQAVLYAMPAPSGDLQGIGLIAYRHGTPIFTATGAVTLSTSGDYVVSLDDIGGTDLTTLGSVLQIVGLTLNLDGQVDGQPYVTDAATCGVAATSTLSLTTTQADSLQQSTSDFTPSGCPLTVTQQPADVTALAGNEATFTAAATGSPTPSVQWQLSKDGGDNWTNDTSDGGVGSPTLTVSSVGASESGYEYRAMFTSGGSSVASDAATLSVSTGSANAPPLAQTTPTSFADQTSFIYGPDGYQTGVASGAIQPAREAVLRGKVTATDGSPMVGVNVTVADHPEYGSTTTQNDGTFYLAVTGGSNLAVHYEKAGYIPVERTIDAPLRDYGWLPDVALTKRDTAVTAVDLSASAPQVVQASPVSDFRGQRQASLLFMPGTQATMVMPDGSTSPLSDLHVRATELTVGSSGPDAMPGLLPPTSAYTYAVDFSADEAVDAGAASVQFNQPVISYTTNFLNMPAGEMVPVGYYDPSKHAWDPEPDGDVIKVLSDTNGMADLDVDGTGTPATADELTALGISDSERAQIATMYQPGQSFWRVPVTHFSVWDFNWAALLPTDGVLPDIFNTLGDLVNSLCSSGSIVDCSNQRLGESVPVQGTPFTLHYQSDRSAGNTTGVRFRIIGPQVPDHILATLEINVAGRTFEQEWSHVSGTLSGDTPLQSSNILTPNLTYDFHWDGLDAFGRRVVGPAPLTATLSYTYDDGGPAGLPIETAGGCGCFRGGGVGTGGSGGSGSGGGGSSYGGTYGLPSTFGALGSPIGVSVEPSRTVYSKVITTSIGGWTNPEDGLGGWSLSVHHSYDANAEMLYRGDGTQQQDSNLSRIARPVPENASPGIWLTVGPDGDFYECNNNQVWKVDRSGNVTVIAGTGNPGWTGDGGPATQADLNSPRAPVFDTAGNLYILDAGNNVVRRIAPDGTISTYAGTGVAGDTGDGGPATQAEIDLTEGASYPWDDMAIGPDGSLYIGEFHGAIRRIDPGGTISTYMAAQSPYPIRGLVVAPDGTLYMTTIADGYLALAKYTTDQQFSVVTDDSGSTPPPDGTHLPVLSSSHIGTDPQYVTVDQYGDVFFADDNNNGCGGCIREITPDGTVRMVGGAPAAGSTGVINAGDARNTPLYGVAHMFVDNDGTIYGTNGNQLFELTPPHDTQGGYTIASEDGTEYYDFDSTGRQTDTIDARTGAALYTFGYDAQGQLSTITDGDNNVTTIDRDSNGNPTGIDAPFGQHTTLGLDGNGYLNEIEDVAGDTWRMTNSSTGLLQIFQDPLDHNGYFMYDSEGRLTKDTEPDGSYQQLNRTDIPGSSTSAGGWSVTDTTAMGRTTVHTVEQANDGSTTLTYTDPAGISTTRTDNPQGSSSTWTQADGTTETTTLTDDPRFGPQSPFVQSYVLHMPSGLTLSAQNERGVITAPGQPLVLSNSGDAAFINGTKKSETDYNAANRTLTTTSAAGRVASTVIDSQERPVTINLPGELPISNEYDSHGRLRQTTQGDRVTKYFYDTLGRLETFTNAKNEVTSYGYDQADRLSSTELPDGKLIGFGYDADGRLTSVTPPGEPQHSAGYTETGSLQDSIAPPLGTTATDTHYDYNADGQLKTITLPDQSQDAYSYDPANGRLDHITEPGGVAESYKYDPTSGRVTQTSAPGGETEATGYDGPLPISRTYSGPVTGSVSNQFDNKLHVASQSVDGANTVSYSYDPDGLINGAGAMSITPDPVTGKITSTSLGVVTSAVSFDPSYGELSGFNYYANTNQLYGAAYMRDKLGRITQDTESTPQGTDALGYDYNNRGQLDQVTDSNGPTINYGYNDNGDRTSIQIGSNMPTTAMYNAQDQITQQGDTSYTYNTNGQRASQTDSSGTTRYSYDGFGQLTDATLPNGDQVHYILDTAGRRVARQVNGATTDEYLYGNEIGPVAQLDGNGNLVARFVYGTNPVTPDYLVKGGITYRVITDERGSPRLIVNTADGTIAEQMSYDPWGQTTQDTNPGFQPFGYAGGLNDPATHLDHFGAREYDPATGSFTATDPIGVAGGSTAAYGYASDDPINSFDPTGLSIVDCLANVGLFPLNLALNVVIGEVSAVITWFGQETGLTSLASSAAAYWAAQAAGGNFLGDIFGPFAELATSQNLAKTAITLGGAWGAGGIGSVGASATATEEAANAADEAGQPASAGTRGAATTESLAALPGKALEATGHHWIFVGASGVAIVGGTGWAIYETVK